MFVFIFIFSSYYTRLLVLTKQSYQFGLWISYLFSTFAGLIQVSAAVQGPLDQFVPASLDAEQQVFDEHHVLLEAGKAKLRAGFLQSQDLLPVGVHLIHKDLRTRRKN